MVSSAVTRAGGIEFLFDRSPESAPDVRCLASEVFDPANLTTSMELKRPDLADRLGDDAERHLSACGLIEVVDDDLVVITDTSTFDYVGKLAAIVLPLDKVAEAPARMADHHVASVQALIDLYRSEIWQPFTDAGLPCERWHSIADKTSQLRPLAIGLGIQAFRQAIDDVVGKVAAEEAQAGPSEPVVDLLVVRRQEPWPDEPHHRHADESGEILRRLFPHPVH
jgi:hypothetical protein